MEKKMNRSCAALACARVGFALASIDQRNSLASFTAGSHHRRSGRILA